MILSHRGSMMATHRQNRNISDKMCPWNVILGITSNVDFRLMCNSSYVKRGYSECPIRYERSHLRFRVDRFRYR